MNRDQPRLRMFAGPNGSGKTTIKNDLNRSTSWFGIYLNPDELEKSVRDTGTVELEPLGFTTDTEELRAFFRSSLLLREHGLEGSTQVIEYKGGNIDFCGLQINSYHASVLSDFLRRKALESGKSFSFETVMSNRDKVELLREARAKGFRTYLYYVATEDPEINVARVKNRLADGGHGVPQEKIISRYHRSLNLLLEATRLADRAFFFDTSESEPRYFAETKDGMEIQLKSEEMPNWFKAIWEHFSSLKPGDTNCS